MNPLRIQRIDIADLPATTRSWMAQRRPDIPRVRSLPWMMIGALGAIVVAVTAAVSANGLRAFSRPGEWGPLLVMLLIVGVPGTYVIVRDWRRNHVGAHDGRALGVHFSADVTWWREGLTRVWSIPCGSLRSMHLTMLRAKLGIYPHRLVLCDTSGATIQVPSDVDLLTLWRALLARHPEATATYAAALEDQLYPPPRRPAKPPEPGPAPTTGTPPWHATPRVEFTVLAEPPHVAPPPPPPASTPIDWFALREYLRALIESQGIKVQWVGEQATGVTPVYLDRPLCVQWQTLAPFAAAIEGAVGQELARALASGRATEWVSLRHVELGDWTDISVDDSYADGPGGPASPG